MDNCMQDAVQPYGPTHLWSHLLILTPIDRSAVLYLDGMKYGDRQMTAQGILGTICFLCISRGAPLPRLSPVSPPTSIFHPGLFLSLLGKSCVRTVR